VRKFSRRRKLQQTPPVCKAVDPVGPDSGPRPGPTITASIGYRGATSGAPTDTAALITLASLGGGGLYAGHATTADGTQITASATVPPGPGLVTFTLVGETASGDFFSAVGSTDKITYNPWLAVNGIALMPVDAPAASAASLLQ